MTGGLIWTTLFAPLKRFLHGKSCKTLLSKGLGGYFLFDCKLIRGIMSIRFPQVGAFVLSFGLAVSAQAAITGYVLLPDYSGASGATVTLKSTGASAVTDATGAFNIDTSTEGIAQAPRISRSGTGALSISVASRAPVHVNVFDLKGKLVRSALNAELARGTYEVSPFTGEEAEGVYAVRVSVGSSHKVFQMMRTGESSAPAVSKSKSAALKTLSTADSLSVTYGGDAAGSVAIWVDDGQVSNIVITHKVVSGTVTRNGNTISDITVSAVSSDGLSLSPEASFNDGTSTYEATTPWAILNTSRAWTVYVSVTASGTVTSASSSNIYDGTVSVNIPVTLAALSSSSAKSSSSVKSSSSAAKSSSSVAVSSSSAKSSSSAVSSSSAKSSSSQMTIDAMPSDVAKFVNWVWDNRQASGKQDQIEDFKNLIFYPIIANKDYLKGFENWPYDTVYVNIVGWAVDSANVIENVRSGETVYTQYTETDGNSSFSQYLLPRCPDACARPLMYANPDYSSCPNYSSTNDTHFDMSLWGTTGFGYAGAGGDWGQRTSDDNIIGSLDLDFPHIVGHETGHGFGLPDYYETYQIPDDNYSAITGTYTNYVGDWNIVPKMVMWAGSSTEITATDAWSLRKTWQEIKGNFGY